MAATPANHFDGEDLCKLSHCKISKKPFDSENDDDDGVEWIQCDEINGCKKWFHQFYTDLDPRLISENFKNICDECNDKWNVEKPKFFVLSCV